MVASQTRSLSTIAEAIKRDWKKPYFGALPYLLAMGTLSRIEEAYGADSGRSIVAYFLSNASTWRGPQARAIKKELNAMLRSS